VRPLGSAIIIIIIIIINNKYEGQHSGENKRQMAREEDAWTIAT
jgi:hypothetical protein